MRVIAQSRGPVVPPARVPTRPDSRTRTPPAGRPYCADGRNHRVRQPPRWCGGGATPTNLPDSPSVAPLRLDTPNRGENPQIWARDTGAPPNIWFVCDWFKPVVGKRNHYTLTDIDAHRWPGTAFLKVVEMKIVEDESDNGEGSSSGTPAPKIWRLMGGKGTTDELDRMVKKVDPTQQKKDASRERKRRRKQQAKNAEQAEKDRDKPTVG